MELHRELSYGRPKGSPRKAILALFFFSVKGLVNEFAALSVMRVTRSFIEPVSKSSGLINIATVQALWSHMVTGLNKSHCRRAHVENPHDGTRLKNKF